MVDWYEYFAHRQYDGLKCLVEKKIVEISQCAEERFKWPDPTLWQYGLWSFQTGLQN